MYDDVKVDMDDSSHFLKTLVLPVLQEHCQEFQGRDIGVVEGSESKWHKHLDSIAGIDAYQYTRYWMRGIASRIQYGVDFKTFTIRTRRPTENKTELEKRLFSLQHKEAGLFYPYWTVQAFIDKTEATLLSVGVAKTEELYTYVNVSEINGRLFKRIKAGSGGQEFLYVDWYEYKETGNYFYEYMPGI